MPAEITMPQLSDTMSEGTVVKWLKAEGEKVREGEKIAEVETDKAVMEMEAFEGGTLVLILAKEGDKVAVGAPIAVLAGSKENVAGGKKSVRRQGRGRGVGRKFRRGVEPTGRGRERVESHHRHGRRRGRGDPGVGEPRGDARVRQRRSRRDPQRREAPPQRSWRHGRERQRPPRSGVRQPARTPDRRRPGRRRLDSQRFRPQRPNRPTRRHRRRRFIQDCPETAAAPKPSAPATSEPKTSAPASTSAAAPTRVSRGEKQVLPLSKMRQAIAKGLQASKQNIRISTKPWKSRSTRSPPFASASTSNWSRRKFA